MSAPEFRGIHQAVIDDEAHPEIDFEGARFSGKTWCVAAKIIQSCLRYPGIHWLACRYTDRDTDEKIKPVMDHMLRRYAVSASWENDESAYHFPMIGDQQSKIYCHGLKAQTNDLAKSKVRGLEMGGIWNDQSEETPQFIVEELPFGTRQQGYPHQLIFSPNPPTEDHFLTDRFPEENPFPHRHYYRVSLYENKHNLPPGKIEELEANFPPTHAQHKSLILGQRGVNITGTPVYHEAFARELHVVPVAYDPERMLLEAIHSGQHHPMWLVAQRTFHGGWNLLGGIMGKRMFLEDFLPIITSYRAEWFDNVKTFQTACDPPPSLDEDALRFTNIPILRDGGLRPIYRPNANAPDVREAVIQSIAGHMKRRAGGIQAFQVNNDPAKWLMISSVVKKQTHVFVDGLEASYVWSDQMVSVANKRVRQPKADEWTEGAQRCLENIILNFGAGRSTDDEIERKRLAAAMKASDTLTPSYGPNAWQGF